MPIDTQAPSSGPAQVSSAQQASGGGYGFTGPELINNIGSVWATDRANQTARENTADARRYNTEMANTVYQRGVEDLRAAGLNPILAAGSPDPAPMMGPAQTFMAAQNTGSGSMNRNVSSAVSGLAQSQATNLNSITNLNNASAAKTAISAVSTAKEADLIDQSVDMGAPLAKLYHDHPTIAGVVELLRRIGDTASSAGSAASSGVDAARGIKALVK